MRRRNHFQEQFHIAARPVVYRPTIPLTSHHRVTSVGEFTFQLSYFVTPSNRGIVPLADRRFETFERKSALCDQNKMMPIVTRVYQAKMFFIFFCWPKVTIYSSYLQWRTFFFCDLILSISLIYMIKNEYLRKSVT